MQQFDPNLPNLMTGEITTVVVQDPANTFGPPFEVGNHVLDRTEPFRVHVRWTLDGLLVPLWQKALEDSDWDVSVYAESMGGGNEIRLGTETVDVDVFRRNYEATIDVAGDVLQEHEPASNQSGVYKLVVAVFLNSDLGQPGFDLTGFAEGPFIQVEDPR